MAAHKAGRFAEAEAGYRRVLSARPHDPKALYYLGLLHFHRGELEHALKCVAECLEYAPLNAPAWNTLGSMFIAAGRAADAKRAYKRVTEIAPAMAEGWYNLGICLRDEGNVDAALQALRESITRDPDYFRAYEALAMLLYQLARTPEAAQVYAQWSAREPENAKARHMAAATSNANVPSRAASEYVQELFDNAAASFDANLEQLGYRAPQIVAAAFISYTQGRSALDVLDAGCGTGLCGPLIRPQCRQLVGVDLSPKMLERARRRCTYDELVAAELCSFMQSRLAGFDAVICADTLVYFGPLADPLNAAHETLRESGLLIFTVEAPNDEDNTEHALEVHGRYSHSEAYLRRALNAAGFEVETLARETLRQERQQDVTGFLVVARRR